jgi:hypothetical protein
MGEKRNAYRILVGKPEGKRQPRKPRRSWVDNIKIDLRRIGSGGMDMIDMAQDRDQWRALVNTVMNVRFEVSTAVTMMIIIFWEMTPCGIRATRRHLPEDDNHHGNEPSGSIKYWEVLE